jgi:Tol biopolymer transport system component
MIKISFVFENLLAGTRANTRKPGFLNRAPGLLLTTLLLGLSLLAACSPVQATLENIRITIDVDGKLIGLQIPPGTTTQAALERAGITLNNLDRVDPPSYSVLANNSIVRITRVREVFTVKENPIPFESKRLLNETLPLDKEICVQSGVNGQEQVTYRQVFENDQEVSNTIFKTEVIAEPVTELCMKGVSKPFTPVAIPGKIAYLTNGNAWLMETTTGNRRPVVTTGDLDGRIFSLSPKGDWLLYSRGEKETTVAEGAAPARINSLWAIDLTEENARQINLKVDNVVNFAAWVPEKGLTITYSTAVPTATEPGWQANNDLQMLTFAPTGTVAKLEKILETNMGGVYGWWGTDFAWAPDGTALAYARSDEVGLVDIEKKTQVALTTILPFQTGKNWAWVPGISWSPDHNVLFLVNHRPGAEYDNDQMAQLSPLFDLAGFPIDNGPLVSIVSEVGMFAAPVTSPIIGQGYRVAYLQSREPRQSDTRPYRLGIMDRDGSNRKLIFPREDQQGLKPQRVAWSPATFDNGHLWLAVNYQGDLWLVDSETGDSHQVTGDGSINQVDWK